MKHLQGRLLILCLLAMGDLCLSTQGAETFPEKIAFNRDIRFILSDNCYKCHGPDTNARKAHLRLDLATGAIADLGGRAAIVPGRTDQSELVRRILSTDPEKHMPPPDSGKVLTSRQIALLQKWIEQGAPWEGHWAYEPLHRAPPPPVLNNAWPRNPIDDFILAMLEAKQMAPAPEADRRTLLRRLSVDLTGLPPGPEAEGWLNERSNPGAYEALVDRLLASPRFGERMAMYWLDLVRYADTVGFHGDQPYEIWPYRDYVVQAFNDNVPFDRFTVEQLAGDLMPGATREQKVASGYNRLNMITAEGGAQDKEYLAKYASDRVRTTASVWLGSTLGCAECHDHKFDPFTTKDFYAFAAFFADLKEKGYYAEANVNGDWGPKMQLPTESQATEMERLRAKLAALKHTLDTTTPELAAAQTKWEARFLELEAQDRLGWKPLPAQQFQSKQGATMEKLQDGSVLVSGKNPAHDTYTMTVPAAALGELPITSFRLEALTDATMDKQSLSRGGGNFILTEFQAEVASETPPSGGAQAEAPTTLAWAKAEADYAQKDHPVAAAIDGKEDTGWAVDGQDKAENRKAAFFLKQPLSLKPGQVLTVRMKHDSKYDRHNIGHFRLSMNFLDGPTLEDTGVPTNVVEVIRIAAAQREPQQAEKLATHFRSRVPVLDPVRAEHAALDKSREALDKQLTTTLVSLAVEPRVMRILPRGNWLDDSGETVLPAIPGFLKSPPAKKGATRPGEGTGARLTRLDLARWIASKDNPLTARIFVNRLWRMFFGTGISRRLDDVGSQGEWPTHPELLDWLAIQFMDQGWDVKRLVKLMVTSAAYRQSSNPDATARDRDPDNRWFSRQSRFRLDAEMIRDNALAVSGLLAHRAEGPSVKPYQPDGYWAQLNFPKRTYANDRGNDQYRRGLYTHWQRTFLHPSLLAFDAPTREECTAERPRSNTPLQALTLLNDPTYVEAARVLAEVVLRRGGNDFDSRLKFAWNRVLLRDPSDSEKQTMRALHTDHAARFLADKEQAQSLAKAGNWPAAADLPANELAAWTSVTRVLLNLHETINRF